MDSVCLDHVRSEVNSMPKYCIFSSVLDHKVTTLDAEEDHQKFTDFYI